MRTYHPSPTVLASRVPLYQLGFVNGTARRKQRYLYRPSPAFSAPKTPLYQLGWLGDDSKIIGAAAGAGAKLVPLLSTASWAGPVGVGIAIVGSIIAGLWGAHEARAAGAKTENAAVGSAVTAFDGSLKAIFAAANSSDPSQNISAAQAMQLCQQTLQTYWSSIAQYQQGPGRADASGGGSNCPGIIAGKAPQCNKSCTAGCCVGCMDLYQSIEQCMQVFQAGGGTAQIFHVFGDKYGLQDRPTYTLTYTAPKLPTVSSSVSSAVSSVESALTGGSSSGSLLPLLALGVGAFLLLR